MEIIESPLLRDQVIDPMLLTMNLAKKPTNIHMEILTKNQTNIIINSKSGVNVLLDDPWPSFGKLTIFLPNSNWEEQINKE